MSHRHRRPGSPRVRVRLHYQNRVVSQGLAHESSLSRNSLERTLLPQ